MLVQALYFKNGYIIDRVNAPLKPKYIITLAVNKDYEVVSLKDYPANSALALIIELYSDGKIYRSDMGDSKPYAKDNKLMCYNKVVEKYKLDLKNNKNEPTGNFKTV